MWEPSFNRTPSAPVFAARSEPARSTKFCNDRKTTSLQNKNYTLKASKREIKEIPLSNQLIQ